MTKPPTEIIPGIYRQVQDLGMGLGTLVCKCEGAVFAAGYSVKDGYLVLTCLSCCNATTKLWPSKEDADKLLGDGSVFELKPKGGVN